ncbi:hypothetical protein FA13DRAFT_1715017 [Coprinellus micaceus]|uniref:Uncharacterized protein n=1 Tax=Coprinellus micaceus TaxID=71717 RepID=A0A4Y7SPZ2_COPMI|nr:hypothetical protein FA13DRAFT_1715017 [Coprinellus micaceus]
MQNSGSSSSKKMCRSRQLKRAILDDAPTRKGTPPRYVPEKNSPQKRKSIQAQDPVLHIIVILKAFKMTPASLLLTLAQEKRQKEFFSSSNRSAIEELLDTLTESDIGTEWLEDWMGVNSVALEIAEQESGPIGNHWIYSSRRWIPNSVRIDRDGFEGVVLQLGATPTASDQKDKGMQKGSFISKMNEKVVFFELDLRCES